VGAAARGTARVLVHTVDSTSIGGAAGRRVSATVELAVTSVPVPGGLASATMSTLDAKQVLQ